MDTGKGYFEFVTPDKAEAVRKNKSHPVFEVGQVVRIDGSAFRITRIGKHFVVSAVATAGTESGRIIGER